MAVESGENMERDLNAPGGVEEVAERHTEMAMEALFGRFDDLPQGAQDSVRRYDNCPKNSAEKGIMRAILAGMMRDRFTEIGRRLQGGREIQEETRARLETLSADIKTAFTMQGEFYRKREAGGDDKVLEPLELVFASNWVEQLAKVDFEDFIDTIHEDRVFLKMLAEVNGQETRPRLESGGQMERPGKKMLDPNGENFENNLVLLQNFVASTEDDYEGTEKSRPRRSFERMIAAAIIEKMDDVQLLEFFDSYFGQGEGGVKTAISLMVKLIERGALTQERALKIVLHYEVESRGITFTPEVAAVLKNPETIFRKAHERFAQLQELRRGHEEYLKQKRHGNEALTSMTWEKGAAAVGVAWATITVIFNGVVEIAPLVGGKDTWREIVLGAVEGGAKTVANPIVLAATAVGAVGANVLTDGGVVENLLLSQSDGQRELNESAREEKEVVAAIGARPGMGHLIYTNYEEMLVRMSENKLRGAGDELAPSDISSFTENFNLYVRAWNFPDGPDGRESALFALNAALKILKGPLGLKSDREVEAFFSRHTVDITREIAAEENNTTDNNNS